MVSILLVIYAVLQFACYGTMMANWMPALIAVAFLMLVVMVCNNYFYFSANDLVNLISLILLSLSVASAALLFGWHGLIT
jgi:hypothetical protein